MNKKNTGRPWITSLIDDATGIRIPVAISYRDDGSWMIGRWPTGSVPTIVTDHGWAFDAPAVEAVLRRRGIAMSRQIDSTYPDVETPDSPTA